VTRISEVVAWLEEFAPTRFAESWDNVGLLAGDPSSDVERVMTCLTVTRESCDEAISEGAGLIVSHHPILFRPIQAIRADRMETALVWRLARADVSVYSPHTAFDNTRYGINDALAGQLGLCEVEPLECYRGSAVYKVVVFCPREDREPVLAAAFAAGAGEIGAYRECSYSGQGRGTFFGGEAANPAVGQKGRRESVREWRCEVLVPERHLTAVLSAVRTRHSYEEPAIDVYRLEPPALDLGVGRVGRLSRDLSLAELADQIAGSLGAGAVQTIGDPGDRIQRVAIVCGAGDSLIATARSAGADVLVTGEIRFHQALEARARGLDVIAVGHYASERPAVENLAARLGEAFPLLGVWPSRREFDPIGWRTAGPKEKPPAEAGG
jgi:dinuclear metal center YbgI/SA1388 family protein